MATAAEHHDEAERLLAEAEALPATPRHAAAAQRLLARAQVHAALANTPAPAAKPVVTTTGRSS